MNYREIKYFSGREQFFFYLISNFKTKKKFQEIFRRKLTF